MNIRSESIRATGRSGRDLVVISAFVWLTVAWSPQTFAQTEAPASPSPPQSRPGAAADDGEASTAPAPAEAPWEFACSQAQRLAERDCRMSQTILLENGEQVLLRVTIRLPPVERKPAMMLQLPYGIYLPEGIRLRIDRAEWTTVPVQTCDAGGCYAGLPVDDDSLSRLRGGAQLDVSFDSLSREEVTVPVNLTGFAAVFDKIR